MNTPPWIRSAVDSGLAAARLESRVGADRRDAGEGDDADRASGRSDNGECDSGKSSIPAFEPESVSPDNPVEAPLELDLASHPEAELVAALRGRARGEIASEVDTERCVATEDENGDPAARQSAGRLAAGPLTTTSALVGLVACIVGGFALGGGFTGTGTVEVAEASDVEAQSAQDPIVESGGECETEQGEDYFRGNGPGDRLSPVGVVAAFEHAYYVDKNPAQAVALTTADAGLDPGRLQADGIDKLPEGTSHCLEASMTGDDIVSVQLTEHRPGEPRTVIHQRIHTGLDGDGIYAITKIEHTEGPA